jgi:hypothetical protein
VGAGLGWEARTGHGHSTLWPFKSGSEAASVASALCPTLPQALEVQLKAYLSLPAPDMKGPAAPRFQKCLTMQDVFSQHHGTCPGLIYHRIPVPDFCAPREEVRG